MRGWGEAPAEPPRQLSRGIEISDDLCGVGVVCGIQALKTNETMV